MKGFSLVEIAVVVLIAGMVMLIAAPVFRDVLPAGRLESSSRRVSSVVNRLYNEAVFSGRAHFLEVSFERGVYEGFAEIPESEPEALRGAGGSLPEGVFFSDIDVSGRRHSEGAARIDFAPHGVISPSIVRIADSGGRILSLVIESYTGRVRVEEGYVREDSR
jgi:prepilin-type N-terminal cleavage/methylation domain-containing protein